MDYETLTEIEELKVELQEYRNATQNHYELYLQNLGAQQVILKKLKKLESKNETN